MPENKVSSFKIASDVSIGGDFLPVLIAGPCVIESEEMALSHAEMISGIAKRVGMPYIFKASYDKANRSSHNSFRGPGTEKGLQILEKIKNTYEIPVLTDCHSVSEIKAAGEVVDIIQIPAFLCRQTDLLFAAAKTGICVNIKKGQFLAPDDMGNVIEKVKVAGGKRITITERGTSFGYNRLIVDFTGLVRMRKFGCPIIFDATHSVQMPGGLGDRTGGESEYAAYLAWAAAAVGVDGLFIEAHENPAEALSDGPNMIPLNKLEDVLRRFINIFLKGSRGI
ncbi:3-deoxy-8-phosphooctulonate synthase [bacterium]|nr:3-deoxy-8-phosphooctulonate synthase [bacterium]